MRYCRGRQEVAAEFGLLFKGSRAALFPHVRIQDQYLFHPSAPEQRRVLTLIFPSRITFRSAESVDKPSSRSIDDERPRFEVHELGRRSCRRRSCGD